MPAGNVAPLSDVLGPWSGFYTLLGTASATLIGLLFVAASVASGVFRRDRRGALRVFLSASVVNFSSILLLSMVVLSPIRSWTLLGVLIAACALLGLTHTGLACRDALRDGLMGSIDLEDRTWYLLMPLAGYLLEIGSGVALSLQTGEGCIVLAVSAGLLLLVGIHNAWDITVWSVTCRQE